MALYSPNNVLVYYNRAGVYAQLHVAGVAIVILQHLAGDAVLVGGGAGHNAVGV